MSAQVCGGLAATGEGDEAAAVGQRLQVAAQ